MRGDLVDFDIKISLPLKKN